MVRKPIVAGMFYEDIKEALENQIIECFKSKFGPGELPVKRKDKKIIGVIAPHAGYQMSGPGQAFCYKEISESEEADCYIIIGTGHMGINKAATILEPFETPFGIVKIDEEITKLLIEKGVVVENKEAHEKEHSIEVQLPFLQFINRERDFRIVPIVVGNGVEYEKVGKEIANVVKESGKKVVVICSSDFTHYGISYGYLPFKDNVKENIEKLDKEAIEWIKKKDYWGFLDYVKEKQATICGKDSIAVFIIICKELGGKEVSLLSYYSSGDVTNDYSTCVGYGSIKVV